MKELIHLHLLKWKTDTQESWWIQMVYRNTYFQEIKSSRQIKRLGITEILRRTWLISANKEKQNVVQNPTPAPSLFVRCMILAAVEDVLFLSIKSTMNKSPISAINPIRIATVKSVQVLKPKCIKKFGGFISLMPHISWKSEQSWDGRSIHEQYPSLHSGFVILL